MSSSTTIVDSSDASASLVYDCPPGAVNSGWLQWTGSGLRGGSGMYTRGNGCYVQYTFQGTGVTAYVVPNFDRGIMGCTVDNMPTKWFNVFSAPERFNVTGCSVSGLSDGQHTIRLTNGPMPMWILAFDWFSIERDLLAQPSSAPRIVSELQAYELPSFQAFVPPTPNATSTQATQDTSSPSTSTSTPTSTPASGVSSGVVIGVAVGLGILALLAFALAWFLIRQNKQLKEKLKKQSGNQGSSNIQVIQPFSPNSTEIRESPTTALAHLPIGMPTHTTNASDFNPYAPGSTAAASSTGIEEHAPPRYTSPSPVPRRKI